MENHDEIKNLQDANNYFRIHLLNESNRLVCFKMLGDACNHQNSLFKVPNYAIFGETTTFSLYVSRKRY